MTRYLVTSALPYANGPVHFGQVVGAYLPADCYVRTLRMMGEEVAFVCGTDEYGVAITVGAEKERIPYPDYVARWRGEIKQVFDRLGIEFDVWSGTSISPFHEELTLEFFRALKRNGYLQYREGEQLYCPRDQRFLADRYITGECPRCGHPEARGDECPRCGAWLDALTLSSPRCKVCGAVPERRRTGHWYIDLGKLRDEHIRGWFEDQEWKPNVRTFVANMLEGADLRPITRDLPWGVKLSREEFYTDAAGVLRAPADVPPGADTGKVVYVWFDAPIGYISFTREWAVRSGRPEAWRELWQSRDTRLVHFIGKDNIPFHCVVFPAMLWGTRQGYVLPWQVPANEFYNLQGRKFSTSTGWGIPLGPFFERYDSEVARFYLLSSTPETADTEWRWEDFQACANAALADKIGNLATRVLRFAAKHWDGRVPPLSEAHRAELDRLLLEQCGEVQDPGPAILAFRFRRATEALVQNATVANVFLDRAAPWTLRRHDPERAASVLNTACEWILWLARWMVPFMPRKAQELWSLVGGEGAVSGQPWPGLPRSESWRSGLAGRPLAGVSAVPFPKIPDEAIAEELAALAGRAAAR